MKRFIILLVFNILGIFVAAQENRIYADSLFSTYYHQKVTLFREMPKRTNEVIFIGNSITEGGQWTELFNDLNVLNRGISGDITAGVIHRLDEIYTRKPSKVFLLIGINDLSKGISNDSIVKNILFICQLLHRKSPSTKIFVQSLLPVNNHFSKFKTHTSKAREIKQVNKALLDSAYQNYYEYIDLYNHFIDSNEELKNEYTNDGLHLLAPAYLKWKELIFNKVYEIPSLIPSPKKVDWIEGSFSLSDCSGIVVENDNQLNAANYIKTQLEIKGSKISIIKKPVVGKKYIYLKWVNSSTLSYYALNVNNDQIELKGSDLDGLYYGTQTMMQLVSGQNIKSCIIEDHPAFNWRGYMVDVGRNYQSVNQILQQIDIMSKYKLNVFHFHLTEDIAWRIYSNQYPSLTNRHNMLRNQGMYYSIADVKKINDYCKVRHIKLLIEIDMPGHSAAFKRALGVDMQSVEGVAICKNILTELCDNIDFEYIHIGGDEVEYKYKNFLNEMIDLLHQKGKKVVAWSPGGEVKKGTMLQMWNGKSVPKNGYPAIDSRHLYLNHLDPLEGVVSVFNHKVDDVIVGDSMHPGATLCNWHDRNVNQEADLINMNAVYPIMLAFAERTWKGGGWDNFKSDFGKPGTDRYDAFVEFENRLLVHQGAYFNKLSFPYVKQSNIEWRLTGPYNNNGNTLMQFEPEDNKILLKQDTSSGINLYGGTIILRHFWDKMIGAHLKNQSENTTWYASRTIFSPVDTIVNCWIGFNNYSRSTATMPPPIGLWDHKNSKVWVNGVAIDPPSWRSAAKQVNLETPLIDEGYEYRSPTQVHLKKGNNTILIKCPITTFIGKDWQYPVKWMFTFVLLDKIVQ